MIDDSNPRQKTPAPIDRASESIVNPPSSIGQVPIKTTPAISSGEIEITPASFSPTTVSTASPPSMNDPPPSAVMENAMERGKPALPLSTVVGIAGGVLLLLVALALLLFR